MTARAIPGGRLIRREQALDSRRRRHRRSNRALAAAVNPARLAAPDGFTLIEIMVVVVILGILAAFVVPKLMSRPDQARFTRAQSDIKAIETALNLYRLDNGRYPTSLEQLVAPGRTNPDGYLDRAPIDPWDNPYMYSMQGRSFIIRSYGADGAPGGSDYDADIDNQSIE